jgi:hypothetical protein
MNRQLVLRCKWCGARQGVDFHQAVYHPDLTHYPNWEPVDMTPYLSSSHAWHLSGFNERRESLNPFVPPAEPDTREYCDGPHPGDSYRVSLETTFKKVVADAADLSTWWDIMAARVFNESFDRGAEADRKFAARVDKALTPETREEFLLRHGACPQCLRFACTGHGPDPVPPRAEVAQIRMDVRLPDVAVGTKINRRIDHYKDLVHPNLIRAVFGGLVLLGIVGALVSAIYGR